MAASKLASIKLTLDKSGFSGGLRSGEAEVKSVSQRMGAALKKGLDEGITGGKRAISDLASSIKGTITTLGGLAGGIGLVDLARDAVLGAAGFRHLADAAKRGSGELVDWKRLQEDARASANRWAQDTDQLGKAMTGMFEETGDIEFARQAIDSIATAARAGVGTVEQLGSIAGTLNEKFGVAGDDIGEALATVAELTAKGGISVEDMSQRLGLMGAAAKEAGLTGEDGFRRMVALMNIADDSTGNLKKGIAGVSGILETLGEKKSMTKVAQTLGIDVKGFAKDDVEGRIEQILKKTRGDKGKLETVFSGEQLKIVSDLGKQYAAAYDATTGDVKTKAAAGVEAVRKAFDEAAKTTTTFADIQADAAKEMQSTEARMQTALNRLRDVFLREDIQEAINKLAESLPKLADAVASMVGFAVDRPGTAGVAAVAAVGLNGAVSAGLSSVIGAAFSKGGASAAAQIASGMASGAAGAGTGMASSFAASAGLIGLAIAGAVAVAVIANEADEAARKKQKQDNEAQLEELNTTGETYDPKTGKYIRKVKGLYGYGQGEGEEQQEFDVSLARTGIGDMAGRFSQAADQDEVDAELDAQEAAYWGRKQKPQQAQGEGGAMSPQDQALLAEMIAAKKLRVEVVNYAQIRSAAAGAPPVPVPGNVKR